MARFWKWFAAVVRRRPGRMVGAALAGVVVLGVGLPALDFVTSQETLVDPGSQAFEDNARYQDTFGGEAMMVLMTGDIGTITSPDGLAHVRALEEDLRATGEFETVTGPAVVLDFAQAQLTVAPDMIAEASERDAAAAPDPATAAAVRAEFDAYLDRNLARVGAAGEPSLDNPAFVDFLLHGEDGEIRPVLRDTFIDEDHALVLVRLPGNASIEEQARGADAVDEVLARHPLDGVEVLSSGPPVLLREINDYLQGGMATLGAFALGAMVLLLLLVFRVHWSLLPVAVVVVGLVGAFGAAGLAGLPLTLVTISALPILLGLGVDFAIQFQNRFAEERGEGRAPDAAADVSLLQISPPVAVAMIAAVVGFLALQQSEVPMIREFGSLLSLGVVVLILVALLTVVPTLLMRDRRHPTRPVARHHRMERVVGAVSSLPARTAVVLLVVGSAVAVAGLVAEGGMPIETDPDRWIDQDGEAATGIRALEEGAGFTSELSILIEAPDVTAPEVAAWMQRFGEEEVERHEDVFLRATSMPGLATGVHGTTPGGDDIPALLSVAPDDIARSLVNEDRTKASMIFPIPRVPLAEREAMLDDIVADLDEDLAPPDGVTATPAGLVVTGVELVNGLEAGRRTLTLIALGLVLLWLLIVERQVLRALLTLVPVAVAVGASSLVIRGLGIELTPLTTVAGPLVIAVGTEFAVLVVARYVEERRVGRSPREAAATGVPRIGRAFVASGLTLLGGFAVLALSPMPLLRDFGIVVAIDVGLALASTLVLLAPLLVWADQRGWLGLRHLDPPAYELVPAEGEAHPAPGTEEPVGHQRDE
jgi:hydrophobe/amphiphile efflux-3 (HAE3) family protein